MHVMPIISMAMGVLGAVGQFSASRSQDDAAAMQQRAAAQQDKAAAGQEAAAMEARSLRERNAAAIEAEGMEQKRRMRDTMDRDMGLSRARAAASGVTAEGTPGLYLDEMQKVSGEELDWLDYSTRSKVAAEQNAGHYDYLTGMASADATRAGATATRAGAKTTSAGARQTRMGGWTTLGQSALDFGGAYNWWQR